MKRLRLYAKPKNKNESLKQVVSTIASVFDVIGKRNRFKDKNAKRWAITTTLVNISKLLTKDLLET